MRLILISSLSFTLLHLVYCSDFPIVLSGYGALKGYFYKGPEGTEAQIFKKIPFASAPLGDLRWKKPVPPQPWNQTLDNTFFGPACAQKTVMYDGPVTGFSEDCLHINVYTSERCRASNSSCNVLFVIHGGSGIYGAPMKFPDDTLVRNFVSNDIIVVTTAYRLGAFGAMALGDENALPANLAMHDIIEALKFTLKEIGTFGGDKEKITILGQSEGARIAMMVAFSPGITKPGEKRLFESVISMSGPAGMETPEETIKRSHKVTERLRCTGTALEIVDCLNLLDTQSIVDMAFKVHGPDVLSAKGPFGITMAGELFPIKNGKELRESKEPVRIMLGTTLYEMTGSSSHDKVNRVLGIKNGEECYEKYLRDVKSGEFEPGYNEVSQDIIESTHVFAKYTAEIGGEAYLYEYGYPVHGAHTDDAYFILGFHAYELDENERWLSRAYPQFFINFIKGKRPAEDWSPVTPNLMNYYSVNRSITDDVYPHTKFAYQNNIAQYYDNLVKYDDMLFMVKSQVLRSPVQYKSLNFNGDFQTFLNSLTFVDALVFFCFLVGAICFLCCLCRCFTSCCTSIFCCCCKSRRDCEHEPLIYYQYR